MAVQSEAIPLGTLAPPFRLPDVSTGRLRSLDESAGAKATVVMFLCSHCPYVQTVEERLIALGRELGPKGAAFWAICANDVARYPEDHPDKLAERVQRKGYPFPYLYDESQEVAKAYGAVCTPDLFVFDGDKKLAYHGRLDDSWKHPERVTRQEMRDAIEAILAGRQPSPEQVPTMGCSIKWK